MDHMSPLDAEFWYLEDATVSLHIGACAVFEGPAPSLDTFVAMTRSKLARVPRFRQVVHPVPLGLGRPVWVDDVHFELEYHLRHAALPAPGDDAQLRRLAAQILSTQLDRSRPLWEEWLIEGLEGDRWAVVAKVHHCMVDGVSGAEMMEVLLDLEPDVAVPPPAPWEPEPGPNDTALVLDALGGLAGQVAHHAGALASVLVHPQRLVADVRTELGALLALRDVASSTPPTPMDGPITPHRRWAWATAELDQIKAIKDALGGTVNDVVLAAIAGGLRDFLADHDVDLDAAVIKSLVPVSVRGADEHGQFDNRVSGMIADLPVDVADPVERLATVHEHMAELKASGEAELGDAVIAGLATMAPPALLAVGSRVAIKLLERHPGAAIKTVTTNVPGPQLPLYALGRRLLAYYPYVPIVHGSRIGIAILSYDGHVAFGITGDAKAVPDVDTIAAGIETSIRELAERAKRPGQD